MYEFIDTTATGGQNTLLSLQTIFNRNNLDELLTDKNGRFVTLSIGGRGILPRRINHYETPYRHGARERGLTYDVREISVNFLIEDKSNEGFRERFNRLSGLLLGSQKRLEFTDENAYFVATLQSGETPEEDSNSQQGTLVFLCTNPAKMKESIEFNLTPVFQSFIIAGQADTPWKTKTIFNENADQYRLESNEGLDLLLNYDFIAGDTLEIDSERRAVFLNGEDLRVSVSMSSDWRKGVIGAGFVELKASENTDFVYTERFY